MKTKIATRVVQDIFQRSLSATPSYLILWTLIIFPTGLYQAHPFISISLFIAFFITTLLRLAPFFYFNFSHLKPDTLNGKFLYVGAVTQATIWSAAFVFVIWAPVPQSMKIFMFICTAGLSAGGGLTYSPSRSLAISYVAILLLPCALFLPFSSMENATTMASIFFVYLAYLAVIIWKSNTEYRNALENELKLEEKTRALERISQTDTLTGLYSRRYFEEIFVTEWKRAFREKVPVSILMVDIDHFKRINDTHGHIAGDLALQEFARELQAVFRRCSDIICRFGGEEFAVLLPNTSLENALQRAEVLRSRTEGMAIIHREKTIFMTISIGVTGRKTPGMESCRDLITEADDALYLAKKQGRNQVQVQESHYDIQVEQFELFAENF